jgi:hypothetical protein
VLLALALACFVVATKWIGWLLSPPDPRKQLAHCLRDCWRGFLCPWLEAEAMVCHEQHPWMSVADCANLQAAIAQRRQRWWGFNRPTQHTTCRQMAIRSSAINGEGLKSSTVMPRFDDFGGL